MSSASHTSSAPTAGSRPRNNTSDPGAFAAATAEEQEGSEPPAVARAGVVVCLMGLARAFGADDVCADSPPGSHVVGVPECRSSAHPVPPSTVGRPSAQPLGCRYLRWTLRSPATGRARATPKIWQSLRAFNRSQRHAVRLIRQPRSLKGENRRFAGPCRSSRRSTSSLRLQPSAKVISAMPLAPAGS